MYHTDDTIAAIASAPGGAARGIVRLSGPHVAAILEQCLQTASPSAWRASTQAAVLPATMSIAGPPSCVLHVEVYYWPDQRSYTRQPVAELHTLGSPPLVAAMLATVCAAGARLAEPGEFTLRAFLAGRLDLTQAEAVLGVIDARGQRDLDAALVQLAGGLARPLHQLRESLLELLAHLEAGLDFVEEDIEFVSRQHVAEQLATAATEIDRLRQQLAARRRDDRPPRVVLVGSPNVGKSSLFNALAGESALVSDQPGTTRDYLRAEIDLGGQRVELVDTAGREAAQGGGVASQGAIDRAAQEQSISQGDTCDLRLLCLDSTRALNAWEHAVLATNPDSPQLVILTKCDQPDQPIDGVLADARLGNALRTSARSGRGLPELRQQLSAALATSSGSSGSGGDSAGSLTAERCGESLRTAAEAIARAQELTTAGWGEELVAAELRQCLAQLGSVVGAVYTDDILDRIFSRFCIGK